MNATAVRRAGDEDRYDVRYGNSDAVDADVSLDYLLLLVDAGYAVTVDQRATGRRPPLYRLEPA